MISMFPSTIMLTVGVHLFCGGVTVAINVKDWWARSRAVGNIRDEYRLKAITSKHQYNNSFGNKDMASLVINIVIVALFVLHLITTKTDWGDNTIMPPLLGYVIAVFAMTFILPLKVCLQNPEIWRHVKEAVLQVCY